MGRASIVLLYTIFTIRLVSVPLSVSFCAVNASVSVSGGQVRFVSGHTSYNEELVGDRWVGQRNTLLCAASYNP